MNRKAFTLMLTLLILAALPLLTAAASTPQLPPSMEAAGATIVLLTDAVDEPVAIYNAGDGSGRLFIVEKQGRIMIWDGSTLLPTPFLDIRDLVESNGVELGMHALAFHPDYETNGLLYVNYTDKTGEDSVVAEYRAEPPNTNVVSPDTRRELIEVDEPQAYHNVADMAFGPDGYLYVGFGDGGFIGDPANRAQNLMDPHGKIFRIDPINTNTADGLPYDIPADNPFVEDPDALDEIWAYGVRNPWRMSFDRATGALIFGDVGQSTWEELNVQRPNSPGGENYGWRLMEGFHCYNPQTNCYNPSLTLPVWEYEHTNGNCSITAGYRYWGDAIPEARGVYIFGDYCTGRIWGALLVGGEPQVVQWRDTSYFITAFGEDEAGELYIANQFGGVYAIVPASAAR